MKFLWTCRRTFLSFTGLVLLGVALFTGTDTSTAIAAICIGLSSANAAEKALKRKDK